MCGEAPIQVPPPAWPRGFGDRPPPQVVPPKLPPPAPTPILGVEFDAVVRALRHGPACERCASVAVCTIAVVAGFVGDDALGAATEAIGIGCEPLNSARSD